MLVEHHEDVVLVKPAQVADPTSARFFFHQVKDVSGKAWTAKNLINRPKTKNSLKNSVLGKLVQGTHGQPFSGQLDSILIVATCGFSLPQVNPNQQYQEIGHADLTPEVQKQLREAMEAELGHSVDLTRLRLLKPKLGSDYVAGVVLAIVDLVAAKMPGTMSNARYIYQNLIDELHRRGVIQHDYQSWEKLLKEKALSGAEIEKTLQIHSATPQGDPIGSHIKEVGEKLGLSTSARIRLSDASSAYYRRRKFINSLDQLRVNSEMSAAVDANWCLVEEDRLQEFSKTVRDALSSDSLKYLASFEGFDAAVACEIILKSLGEN
ncbi:hypothetical protein J2789_000155 [Variovorax paradoxus]|nr:hypothetical protein [Variovorax paradoxus]